MSTFLILMTIAVTGVATALQSPGDAATPPAKRIRIVLVGDSTVTTSAGWGLGFQRLLSADVECINLARGGRSSKSFRAEGHWKPVAELRPDYVLIQFGHNDQPGKGPERETDPATDFTDNLKRYVEEARAAGAKAILVTSLTRRKFGDEGRIQSDLTAYVEACRKAAAETGAPLIELNARSIDFCNSLGRERCEAELSPKKDDGTFDTTHLTERGSELIAPLVASELVRVAPELAPYLPATAAERKGPLHE